MSEEILRSWLLWREAKAAEDKARKKMDSFDSVAYSESAYKEWWRALATEIDAWRNVCRLLDAAALELREEKKRRDE